MMLERQQKVFLIVWAHQLLQHLNIIEKLEGQSAPSSSTIPRELKLKAQDSCKTKNSNSQKTLWKKLSNSKTEMFQVYSSYVEKQISI